MLVLTKKYSGTNVVPKIIRDPTSVVVLNSRPSSDAAYLMHLSLYLIW
jgi:hypothetical protein